MNTAGFLGRARVVLREPVRPRVEVAFLALVAYLPVLTARPGQVVADTKLALTVDPGRLIADSAWTWDGRQFGGWVPHQNVGYLWPSGPWYWLADLIGLPDWLTQRLWIGTLLVAAGLGVRWCARLLGLSPSGALAAAFVYQCSPYVLPYISRTSVLLPPWSGLGWLLGLTVLACRAPVEGSWSRRWWPVAMFGLVVVTVGGINATAMLMIAPAPLLYLADATARREVTWQRALGLTTAFGGVSLAVSLWWLAGLGIQGRYGANALAYSETLESTALTSSAPEVLRGLGYWLFYVRDQVAALTSASPAHQESLLVLATSWALILAGVAGITLTTWVHRRLAAGLVLVGVVLAVGAHPVDDPAPLWQPLAEQSRNTLVLALRSSTRAAPLIVLGLALGAGILTQAIGRHRRMLGRVALAGLFIGAALNLPALRDGGYADPALARDETMAQHWRDAAAWLDQTGPGRVLVLPSLESAAFRWGYTVDQPLPALGDKAMLARDWLPLGSPGLMDVLYALDDRFQEGTIEPSAIAPVARLLGADTVLVANDVQFERFQTVRPEVAWEVYAHGVPGLGAPTVFGGVAVNDPVVEMLDEVSLLHPGVGTGVPQVAVFPIDEPAAAARAASGVVLLSGSGDGVVDAAGAGLIDGSEVLVLSAAVLGDELTRAVSTRSLVIVTDSNRDRARHWRGSQAVWGFTEDGVSSRLIGEDPADHRLPAFPDQTSEHQTLAFQRGPVQATASSYGSPTLYLPEHRPYRAIDGRLDTSWVVGQEGNPRGEFLQLSFDQAVDRLTFVQHHDPGANRWVRSIRLSSPDGLHQVVDLDERSRSIEGQEVVLDRAADRLTVSIHAVQDAYQLAPWEGDPVGFAEVRTALGPTDEVVRLPNDLTAQLQAPTPAAYVLTRLRTDPAVRWRDDAEVALVREFDLPSNASWNVDVTVRLSPRADDLVLDSVLDPGPALADRRLPGGASSRGANAADGSLETAWVTPFGDAVGSSLVIPRSAGSNLTELVLHQGLGQRRTSTITEVRLWAGDQARLVPVPAPDAEGRSLVQLDPLPGGTLVLTITATDGATTVDRRTYRLVDLPAAIREIELDGLQVAPAADMVDLGCRDDLLTLDGRPLPLRIAAPRAALLAGDAVTAELCGHDGDAPLVLEGGTVLVRSAAGRDTGVDVDRVILRRADVEPAVPASPVPVQAHERRGARTLEVGPCPTGCWLVQGDGWSEGWSAAVDGASLGTPLRLGAGMNGWWLDPSDSARTVTATWSPQRIMWVAMALSAVAVLAALTVVVSAAVGVRSTRQQHRRPPVQLIDPRAVRRSLHPGAIAVALVIGGLVIQPVWGLVAGAVTAVAWRLRRTGLLAVAALVCLALAGGYVLLSQLRHGYPAGFGWPVMMERAHRPALLGVVLASLAACAAPLLGDEPE